MKKILNYIKGIIYRRKELKRLKLCLKVIKDAKDYYIKKEKFHGMCHAFEYSMLVINYNIKSYRKCNLSTRTWLKNNIPEFNAEYLTGIKKSHDIFWWDLNNIDSRIKAFDKLIDLYKTKIKELC